MAASPNCRPILCDWVRAHNTERPHQQRWCFGKTQMQIFVDMILVAREKLLPAACDGRSSPPHLSTAGIAIFQIKCIPLQAAGNVVLWGTVS